MSTFVSFLYATTTEGSHLAQYVTRDFGKANAIANRLSPEYMAEVHITRDNRFQITVRVPNTGSELSDRSSFMNMWREMRTEMKNEAIADHVMFPND